jgi:hypothetical protein
MGRSLYEKAESKKQKAKVAGSKQEDARLFKPKPFSCSSNSSLYLLFLNPLYCLLPTAYCLLPTGAATNDETSACRNGSGNAARRVERGGEKRP